MIKRVSEYPSSYSHFDFQKGNFHLNFSQEFRKGSHAKNSEPSITESYYAVDTVQAQSEQRAMEETSNKTSARVSDLLQVSPTPSRRSKRREETVDEHSLERAERIKARSNLEISVNHDGTSFLTFSDSQIAANISKIGVSLGKEVQKGCYQIKKYGN